MKKQLRESQSRTEEVKASAMKAVEKFRALLKQHQQMAQEVSLRSWCRLCLLV